jgi:hypothetical protein
MTASGVAAGIYTCTITSDDSYVNGQGTFVFTITVSSGPVQAVLANQVLYVGQALSYNILATSCTHADGALYTPLVQTGSNVG